jgi:cytochrome c oxidase assembly protein subunit 15
MSVSSKNPAPPNSLLPRFAWFVVFYNVVVIVWGALVRASGSGAGCGNHWPLCNGQVIPVSPSFHTIIEFTHRMMVGGSTFFVLALLVWSFRTTVKTHAARALAVASTLLLLNEAFLGALLVKLGYVTDNQSTGRIVLLSIHLGNTLLLLAALTLTARFLSTGQHWADLPFTRRSIGIMEGLVTTIFVGITGSIAALGDTLFPAPSLQASFTQDFAAASPWLLRLRIVHPTLALISALFALWLVAQSRRSGSDQTPAQHARRGRISNSLLALLILQFTLGIADVVLLAPAWLQLLHLLGADLFWIALVLLAAETLWPAAITSPAASPVMVVPTT